MNIKIKVSKEVLQKSCSCPVRDDIDHEDDSIMSYLRNNCAIAIAVRDLFPAAVVHVYTMQFMPGTAGIQSPRNMSNYIDTFDRLSPEERLELPEAEFEVNVPDEVIDKIGINQATEIISKSSTLELIK